jgi:hypothetical protein
VIALAIIVASASVVVVASLAFANAIHRRMVREDERVEAASLPLGQRALLDERALLIAQCEELALQPGVTAAVFESERRAIRTRLEQITAALGKS